MILSPDDITQMHPSLTAAQLVARLYSKLSRGHGDTCWLWTGTRDKYGYGRLVSRLGGKAKVMGAHRVSYVLHNGPIPTGMQIDHLCRVRHCVNPAHLEPVTIAENIARGETGIHQRSRTHCPAGHPYEGENLAICQGARICIACRRARSLARHHARKASR